MAFGGSLSFARYCVSVSQLAAALLDGFPGTLILASTL
jgi:hypothetical protein